jgi:hypothetical protein
MLGDSVIDDDGGGDLDAELAKVEEELNMRYDELRSIETQESELKSQLHASVRDAEEMLRNVGSLQAKIEESADEAKAIVSSRGGYRTPRPQSNAAQPPPLASLVGRWASEPLGLAPATAAPSKFEADDDAGAEIEARQLRMALGLEHQNGT